MTFWLLEIYYEVCPLSHCKWIEGAGCLAVLAAENSSILHYLVFVGIINF